MPIPASIADLSQTAGSNSPSGSDTPNVADDHLRAAYSFLALLRDGKGSSAEVDVASGATCDIGASNSPFVRVTGTTAITSFGTTYNGPRFLRFAGALTLTHNSSTLILPGGANIATAAGDTCVAIPIGSTPSGWQVFGYQKASVIPGTSSTLSTGRTISITGDISYTSPSFDGSANVTAAGTLATVNSNVGSFGSTTTVPVVTVNAKGLVTAVSTATIPSLTSGTAQATTSGTVVDFTGIPSTAKRVTIALKAVSTSGTSNYLVQIGSGSVQTTGYSSAGARISGASAAQISSSGFVIPPASASATVSGVLTLVHLGSNVWSAGYSMGDNVSGNALVGGGDVTLSGALDRVRLTTANGTDTFDAGSANILYE